MFLCPQLRRWWRAYCFQVIRLLIRSSLFLMHAVLYEPVTMHGFRNFIYGFLMTKSWPIFFFLLALLSLYYRQASLSVRCPHSSNISSGIAGPIKARFQMEPQWDRGTEVCSNDPGHVTKMVAMPIYGKNPLKIFFSRTKGPMTLGLAMSSWSIGDLGPRKFVQMMTLGWPWPFFWQF